MARLPRLSLPGVPQHVIQRGNNRQACFFDGSDYSFYLEKLKDYADKYDVEVHAYVLMTNHVHLLATAMEEGGISRMMQALGRTFVRYINHRYRRTGTLWEGRFKSTLIDSEVYLLQVSRYIELNPVRANMVKHPVGYPWSSFAFNGRGQADFVVTPHDCYLRLASDPSERCRVYRDLFKSELSGLVVSEIRDSLNKSWVLGDGRFQKQIGLQLGRAAGERQHGGDRRSERYRSGR